jgi:DNA-binding Lrp family transcriptional regulator
MARSDTMDEVDLKILQALNIDGRVPFSTIARVIGVSDQTVARRYSYLRATKGVRVLGRTHPHRVGDSLWFVRVRCSPNAASALGDALVRRPETSWVKLTSGGTEIVAVIRAPAHGDSPTSLLEKLPRTRDVLGVSANGMLHMFFGGPQSILQALTDDQVEELQPPQATAGSAVTLDEVDRRILGLLEQDGRADFAALAKASGIAQTTVRRRLSELRASGALYFDVDLDYQRLEMDNETVFWITVNPRELRAAGELLASHPEVAFAAATTGTSNLFANVLCPDAPSLFDYLTTKIAALPSLVSVESASVIRTLKRL